jgi:hypothetical protein
MPFGFLKEICFSLASYYDLTATNYQPKTRDLLETMVKSKLPDRTVSRYCIRLTILFLIKT